MHLNDLVENIGKIKFAQHGIRFTVENIFLPELINKIIDLSNKDIDIIFFDWIPDIIEYFDEIESICNKEDIILAGIYPVSKAVRTNNNTKNQKIIRDLNKIIDRIIIFTFDDLIQEIIVSKIYKNLKYTFISILDPLLPLSQKGNDLVDINFIKEKSRSKSQVYGSIGLISKDRNLAFIDKHIDYFRNERILIRGNSFDSPESVNALQNLTTENKYIYLDLRFLHNEQELYDAIDVFIFDTELYPDPSGFARNYLNFGSGILLIDKKNNSYFADLSRIYPNLPIIDIEYCYDGSIELFWKNLNFSKYKNELCLFQKQYNFDAFSDKFVSDLNKLLTLKKS